MRKKKRNRKKKQKSLSRSSAARGFDFGFLQRVMYASTSSVDLNNHMTTANVVGCAYGFDRAGGYPAPIPRLTFVAELEGELRAATKCLESWGCADDGDSVDIDIVLKNDGGYLLGMQPNYARMMMRMVKDSALVEPIFSGATWIKSIDTTNPMLFEWKDNLKSKIAPIKVGFATAKFVAGVPQFDTIKPLEGALSFVKFGLTIQTEEENPDHWFFDIVRHTKRKSGPFGPRKGTPKDVAAARANVINSAFPVSRTRIHRQGLTEKIEALTSTPISKSQVEQAAINILLSREWTDSQDHYVGVANLDEEWWKRVGHRVEIAEPPDTISGLDLTAVFRQLTLDVEYTLRHHGANVSAKFATNQKLFMRLGYG
ncbi:hypothetical protein [Thalassospira profundimaris]|uniref:hypothetical protein n=1 Tax=Thalassospira profundimaris TaxID=502049 RepID=UPI0002871D53|nr:hypothetical protein [Thalassospira profundimaris]EKF07609.1 hypothetical protein TH2_14389 [Thalassospira profundimaris WP0211]